LKSLRERVKLVVEKEQTASEAEFREILNKKSLFGEFEKGTDYHLTYAFKHGGGGM